nr:ribonuclease H-like domain-containing protein [Tanacetum cinerariifolium]
MRIDQYFLMTDYSLWEVILNGDSPVPIRIVEGVLQPVAPTTAEQSSEDLDQIHDRLQKLVSQLEIHGVSLSQKDVNLKLMVQAEEEPANYDWSYQAEEEPANYALMAFSSNSSSNNELSPTKPEQDLSHTTRPSAPIIEDWVSDFEDESETKAPQFVLSFVQSSEQVKYLRHSIQPIETSIPAATPAPLSQKSTSSGKIRNRKTCFVCKSVDHLIKDSDYHAKKIAQPTQRNYAHRADHKQYASLPHKKPQKHMVPTAVLTQSKPTSNLPPRVTAAQAPVVSAAQGVQGKWIQVSVGLGPKGNMSYLSNFEELNDGYVAFGGNPKGGKISGKGKIKTRKLDFEDVYFVKELKFNIFSVSQMGDKKNSVLFTDTDCLVLSSDFKLLDESQVLLRVPRENNMYNVNLKNIVPSGDLTCLFTKATIDESNLWHRRMGHINFKTINKLVKGKEDAATWDGGKSTWGGWSRGFGTIPAFPLPGESSHWQYKFPLPVKVVPTARRLEMPLSGVCTAIEEMMKKLPVKDRWQLH